MEKTTIEIGGLYRLFYNENNPNNDVFEVRGIVDDVVVCRSLLGRTFIQNIYLFDEGYITPISKDAKIALAIWGIDQKNKVVSFNDLVINNPEILADPWVTIYLPETVKDCGRVATRSSGKGLMYLCPIRNTWHKY